MDRNSKQKEIPTISLLINTYLISLKLCGFCPPITNPNSLCGPLCKNLLGLGTPWYFHIETAHHQSCSSVDAANRLGHNHLVGIALQTAVDSLLRVL